jgi:hypothetical protein
MVIIFSRSGFWYNCRQWAIAARMPLTTLAIIAGCLGRLHKSCHIRTSTHTGLGRPVFFGGVASHGKTTERYQYGARLPCSHHAVWFCFACRTSIRGSWQFDGAVRCRKRMRGVIIQISDSGRNCVTSVRRANVTQVIIKCASAWRRTWSSICLHPRKAPGHPS